MKNKEILIKLGLGEKESNIYIDLLESGASTISNISKHTGIHRPLIYKAPPILEEKGLISESIKGKQKLYVAESPTKLKGFLTEIEQDFKNILPELEQMHHLGKDKPLVKFLVGKKGIKFVFEDLVTSLKRGDIFYRYSSAKDTVKANEYLPANYREKRDNKQLERLVITSQKTSDTKKHRLERDIKIMPGDKGPFDYDVTQIIYGSKVALIDYNTETALIIENPTIAEFQKRIFRLLYKKL